MTDSPQASLFSPRERRILLWLCVGAICWRWLLAIRAPLPGVDASLDLWVARRLATGDFAALGAVWWRPWWALCVAPFVACGAPAFVAGQVVACVFGGLVIWPLAAAAERLRQGAGIPCAVVALAAAVPAQGAAMASALPLACFGVALAALCWVQGRWLRCGLLTALVLGLSREQLLPGSSPPLGGVLAAWTGLRGAWSLAGAFAVLSVLPPRPRRIVGLWIATAMVLAATLATGTATEALAQWSPLVACLAGVGLARWPKRLAELALSGIIVVDFLGAWQAIESREAVVERLLGAHLATRAGMAQGVVCDLPRITFFAGGRPRPLATGDALLQAASAPEVQFVVLSRTLASATTTSALSSRFVRYQVPAHLRDLVADHRLAIFVRRE
ncbi:MAG: hypothetical protein KA020_13880 [Planctomycetes bacterium]|nr:hypothetical protein [Planctomycetota bacterium]